MSNVIPFDFNRHKVRVINKDGEPWFVAKDVAEILGYARPRDAIKQHCKKAQDVGVMQFTAPIQNNDLQEFRSRYGIEPNAKIIPEPDVYRLIMRSRLPAAEAFEELVVGKILPTIRKTGQYGGFHVPQSLPDALQLAADQAREIETLKPNAEALERLEASEGSQIPRVAAKALGMPERKFFHWLYAHNWAFRQGKTLQGYAEKIKAGYLEHEMRVFTIPQTGEERSCVQLKITPKGMARLAQIFGRAA